MYLYLLSSCKEELLNRQRKGVTSIRNKNILSKDTTQNEVSTVLLLVIQPITRVDVIDSSVDNNYAYFLPFAVHLDNVFEIIDTNISSE